VPQEELGVDLPQESSRFVDPLSSVSLGHLPDVQGGDGVDWGLTKTAGVGRRRQGVGRSRGASPVRWPWEVAARRSLHIEDYVGYLPGSPLVLKEGEELLRGATSAEVGETNSDERAVPAPLVGVEVGSGAGSISHVVLAQNLPCSRGQLDLGTRSRLRAHCAIVC
jgi:hypothetical protein